MVLELIATNQEARKERMAWEKQLSEIEDAKEQKRADSDRQMILTGIGQMIGAFTQYMGPAASSFPFPLQSHITHHPYHQGITNHMIQLSFLLLGDLLLGFLLRLLRILL